MFQQTRPKQNFHTEPYSFLVKPPSLTEYTLKTDSFISNNPEKYRLIQSTNNERFRVYRRRISDYGKEMNIFKWRNETCKPIVKVLYIQNLDKKFGEENINELSEIYTDHIAHNFLEIRNLSIVQTLFLLKKSISGFEAILQALGYVTIDPAFCGVDHKGDCKVWINENISENKGGLNPKLQQSGQIISELLKIIKRCSSSQCNSFFTFLLKSIPSMEKLKFRLIEEIISKYCIRYQITIPLYLKYQTDSQISLSAGFGSSNKTLDLGRNQNSKSSSNHSFTNSRHRASQLSSNQLSNKGSQRISLVEKMPNTWKTDNFQVFASTMPGKKHSLGSNAFLRATCDSKLQNTLTRTAPSYSSFQEPSKFSQVIHSIKKNDQWPQRGSVRIQNSMMKSSVNQMVSLHRILGEIVEGNDEINENIDSDHIIEGKTFKEIVIPSQKDYKNPKNHNRICHQFCINLITEKIFIEKPPSNDHLTVSFTNSSSTKGHCESVSITPRLSLSNKCCLEKGKKRPGLATSYNSEDLQLPSISPRFSCDKSEMNTLQERFSHLSQKPMDKVYQVVESDTCIQPSYGYDEDKENRSLLYEKSDQKRPNKKRRNSRLLREKLEEQEEEMILMQQQNRILSVNKWKKFVNTLTESDQNTDLKFSISFEVENQKKRSPPKLNMLDQLGAQLTESIIPN